MHARERVVGVEVHRQALAGIEELDEYVHVDAVARDVRLTEEGLRLGADRGVELPPVGQGRYSHTRLTERRRHRRDPLLGRIFVGATGVAQVRDARPASIETMQLVRRKVDRLHEVATRRPRCCDWLRARLRPHL
jgi:hypothetical protein